MSPRAPTQPIPPSLAPARRLTRAFSLVEITLALGITTFCLLALFGLLPHGLETQKHTQDLTKALSIANEAVLDLRITPVGESKTTALAIPLESETKGESIQWQAGLTHDGTPVGPNATPYFLLSVTTTDPDMWNARVYHIRLLWPYTGSNAGTIARNTTETVVLRRGP